MELAQSEKFTLFLRDKMQLLADEFQGGNIDVALDLKRQEDHVFNIGSGRLTLTLMQYEKALKKQTKKIRQLEDKIKDYENKFDEITERLDDNERWAKV